MQDNLTLLTTVYGAFQAHVLEARLRSEGIDVELRGALDGPYGFSVGDMARNDVYVPSDQLDDARLVLLADEADAALEPSVLPARRSTWPLWLMLAVIVLAGLAPLVRLVVTG